MWHADALPCETDASTWHADALTRGTDPSTWHTDVCVPLTAAPARGARAAAGRAGGAAWPSATLVSDADASVRLVRLASTRAAPQECRLTMASTLESRFATVKGLVM